MHMTDALLSPVVAGTMTAVSVAAIGYSAKKISEPDEHIPMMGVMGAFIFAAQMINFVIPATGSSGHISGGILLSAILGPFPALIVMSSVLLIQCLFFADGGLMAYGCNVFNIGICACLIAYPLVFRPIVRGTMSRKTITAAAVFASVMALQLGAFGVVLETTVSGVAALPFGAFAALMQPIHLAIGLVEGLVTAAVLCFIHSTRPVLLTREQDSSTGRTLAVVLVATILLAVGSVLSSTAPDGLEWSLENTAEAQTPEGVIYDTMGGIVDATALMPGYEGVGSPAAGITGGVITLALVIGVGLGIRIFRKHSNVACSTSVGKGAAGGGCE